MSRVVVSGGKHVWNIILCIKFPPKKTYLVTNHTVPTSSRLICRKNWKTELDKHNFYLDFKSGIQQDKKKGGESLDKSSTSCPLPNCVGHKVVPSTNYKLLQNYKCAHLLFSIGKKYSLYMRKIYKVDYIFIIYYIIITIKHVTLICNIIICFPLAMSFNAHWH